MQSGGMLCWNDPTSSTFHCCGFRFCGLGLSEQGSGRRSRFVGSVQAVCMEQLNFIRWDRIERNLCFTLRSGVVVECHLLQDCQWTRPEELHPFAREKLEDPFDDGGYA